MLRFLIILIITSRCVFAQDVAKIGSVHKSSEISSGDIYFANNDYFLAIKNYEKALVKFPNDDYLLYQLAESNRLIFNYENAEPNYAAIVKIIESKTDLRIIEHYPLIYYKYASTLKANDKCEFAKKQYEKFIHGFKPKNIEEEQVLERAVLEYNGCAMLAEQKSKLARECSFEILPPPVNSPNSDYAPAIFLNDSVIAVTSARKSEKDSKLYNTTGEHFSNIFLVQKNLVIWRDISQTNDFTNINSTVNEGAGCFNNKKDKFYFTKCNVANNTSSGECNIFVSTLKAGKWGEPIALNPNINYPGYWSAQPALSTHNDTLFFVSKRPGGKGSHDIWMSTKSGDGDNWGQAINLNKINTTASDVTPFYEPKSQSLFFSSNGYEGVGELDIFKTKDSSLENIHNIGLPFNSPRDDFYYTTGEKYGYLASNRVKGVGSDDIYRFYTKTFEDIVAVLNKDKSDTTNSVSISGKLVESNILKSDTYANQTKNNVNDTILDIKLKTSTLKESGELESKNVLNKRDPNKENSLKTNIVNDSNKLVNTNKTILKPDNLKQDEVNKVEQINPTIEKKNQIIESKLNNDTKSLEVPAANVTVLIKDTIGRIIRKSTTDDEGKFRFESLNSKEKLKVIVPTQNSNVTEKSTLKVTDLKITTSSNKTQKVTYEHVFFDFDDFKLRPEALVVLDQLYAIIVEKPTLQIELKGYADNVGSEEYNKKLAALRSEEVFNYLKQKGIDKTALVESYGEQFAMAPNTNPIGRQLNRRLDFGLIGADTLRNSGQIYINTVNQSLDDVAKLFSVSKEQLMEMNRIHSDSILPFKPIRVPTYDNNVISNKTLQMSKDHQYDKYNKLYDYSGTVALQNKGAIVKENGVTYYTVQKGNTIFSIAKYFKTQPDKIVEINNLPDYNIGLGQKLKVIDNRE